MDTGTAYGRSEPSYDAGLVEVGPGTPAGEMLRRYWHPIAVAAEVTVRPRNVRVLGGGPRSLPRRQRPAGPSLPPLLPPRNDALLRQGGALGHPLLLPRLPLRRPWPVPRHAVRDAGEESERALPGELSPAVVPGPGVHGTALCLPGPPEKKPVLPRYDVFGDVPADEEVVADGNNIGLEGETTPCNWLQTDENVMDPYHVFVLHSSNSGNQFVPLMGLLPEVSWERTALGVKSHQDRKLPDGKVFHRVTEVMMPNLRIIANPFVKRYGRTDSVAWTLPIDDATTRIFTLYWTPKGERVSRVRFNGRRWAELTEEEHQRMPNDYEAQVGQGAITLHSEEHLAASDRGVGMDWRLLREQMEAVQAGRDPLGVIFEPERAVVQVQAGNFILEPA